MSEETQAPDGAEEAVAVAEEKPAKAKKAKAETVRMVVMRDYWTKADEDGGRVTAGSIVEVSFDAAMAGLENGSLARAKD